MQNIINLCVSTFWPHMNDDSFWLKIYKMALQEVRTFVSVLYHVSLHLLQIIRTENFINSLMAYLSLILSIVLWSDHLAVWRREEDQNIWWRCPNTSYQPSRLIRVSPLTKIIRNTMSLDSKQSWLVIEMIYLFVPEYEKYHVWRQSGTESSWSEVKEQRLISWLWWNIPLLTWGDSAVK